MLCPGPTLASCQQAMQRKILSGTLKCPPMDFVNYMKHFKLDPLYASVSTKWLEHHGVGVEWVWQHHRIDCEQYLQPAR